MKVEIDLEKGKAEIKRPDPKAILEEIQNYSGFPVEDGQYTKIKVKDGSKYKLKFKDDTLHIKAPEVIL